MMFASNDWRQCQWVKHPKGLAAYHTTTSMEFWDGVETCLKVFAPLVEVLRLVDGDQRPTMGFLHGELEEAKKEIRKALNNLEKTYEPILTIIDQKSEEQEGNFGHPTAIKGCSTNDENFDPDCAIHAQDWIVEDVDGDISETTRDTSKDNDSVRELRESDFESADEGVDIDFESDDEHV
ncbi:unnamed protein product [Arabis nemorensis]|uniref:Uncharacterized protein n=1 Tax=Arabis nemorensis TaxID=586526 RepID=A0A565CWF0_9BRAS|nr:unnamed protein product [Arabis nemorensis]